MKNKFIKEKMINEWHSSSSLNSYESLFYHISQDKNLDFEKIETFNLDNVLNFFQKNSKKWKDSTYNFYIKKFRVFLKFLDREKKIGKFYQQLRFKKVDKTLPKYVEKEDLEKILKILNEEEKRIFKFFLYTGVRRFEFSNLSKENINFERKEIKIFWKWRKERIIPIHSAIFEDLEKMNFPFWIQKIDGLRRKIQKSFPNFKIHNLRHTFATSMVRSWADIYPMSQIMGHSNINTTTIYLSLDTSSAKKEIEKIKFDFF